MPGLRGSEADRRVGEISPASPVVDIVGGWVVGTGATNHSEFEQGVERAASTFVNTTPPDGTLDTVLKDAFRSENVYTGDFASGDWVFHFVVRAVTNGGAQDGRVRFRLIKADLDLSNAVEITSAQQLASIVVNVSTSADFDSTLTFNPGAFSIANQYLFIQVAWERTGAGGMSSSDIDFRTGSSSSVGTRITTADFSAGGQTFDETGRQVTIVIVPSNQALAVRKEIVATGGIDFADDFNRADGNSLGASWSESESAADALSILSNRLRFRKGDGAVGFAGVAYWATPVSNDHESGYTHVNGEFDFFEGLVVRGSGTYDNFTGYVYLIQKISGITAVILLFTLQSFNLLNALPAPTFDATINVSLVAGDTARISVVGTTIRLYLKNVERAVITNATIASGSPGVATVPDGGLTDTRKDVDNWVGRDLALRLVVSSQDARAFDADAAPVTIVVSPLTQDEAVLSDKSQVGPLVLTPAARDLAALKDSLQQTLTILPTALAKAVFSDEPTTTIAVVASERDLAVFKDSLQGGIVVILPSESDSLIGAAGGQTYTEFGATLVVIVPGVGDVLFPIRFTAGGTRSEVTDRRRGHTVPDSHRHSVSGRLRRSQRQ